ncbi:MAG: hypothetical protein SGPRY_009268 [Prymnesium sp.]
MAAAIAKFGKSAELSAHTGDNTTHTAPVTQAHEQAKELTAAFGAVLQRRRGQVIPAADGLGGEPVIHQESESPAAEAVAANEQAAGDHSETQNSTMDIDSTALVVVDPGTVVGMGGSGTTDMGKGIGAVMETTDMEAKKASDLLQWQ